MDCHAGSLSLAHLRLRHLSCRGRGSRHPPLRESAPGSAACAPGGAWRRGRRPQRDRGRAVARQARGVGHQPTDRGAGAPASDAGRAGHAGRDRAEPARRDPAQPVDRDRRAGACRAAGQGRRSARAVASASAPRIAGRGLRHRPPAALHRRMGGARTPPLRRPAGRGPAADRIGGRAGVRGTGGDVAGAGRLVDRGSAPGDRRRSSAVVREGSPGHRPGPHRPSRNPRRGRRAGATA